MASFGRLRRILPVSSKHFRASGFHGVAGANASPITLSHVDVEHDNVEASSTPLLVLHGLLGNARNWTSTFSRGKLTGTRGVSLVDLRNHGRSPHHPDMDTDRMADDVVHFAQNRGFDKIAVLGHSMGGKVAMNMALRWPDYVEDLIVVDMAPVEYSSFREVGSVIRALADLDLKALSSKTEASKILAKSIPDTNMRSFCLTNLVQDRDNDTFQWRVNLDAIQKNMENIRLHTAPSADHRYEGRTLFLGGGASDYILPSHEPAIRHHFPRSEIKMVPDASHWVHMSKPAEFGHAVSEFLQGFPY